MYKHNIVGGTRVARKLQMHPSLMSHIVTQLKHRPKEVCCPTGQRTQADLQASPIWGPPIYTRVQKL